MHSGTGTVRAGRRAWLGLAVLALPTVLIAIDMSVLHLAVPKLTAALRPSGSQILWITDIYPFLIAGLLVPMGVLGDRIGRRRLLLAGAAAFGVASVLAAYAPSAELLIAARALLGVAGATLMPSTLSLIRAMFPDEGQRKRAISVWMASFTAGSAGGPLLGGALLEHFWWGSALLIGVPVMLVLLAAGPVLLPEHKDANPGRLDLYSAALGTVALLAATWGLKDFAANGLDWKPVAALVLAGAFSIHFVRRQRRLADPFVDVQLFNSPVFSLSLGLLLMNSVVMMGVMFLAAQHLQLVVGLSPLTASLWMLPVTAAMIVTTTITPALAKWVRASWLISAGLLLSALGLVVLARVDAASGPLVLIAGIMMVAFGMGPGSMLSTDLVVSSAPEERAGAASALSETCSELGAGLGLAVMGSIGFAVYRAQMDAGMPQGTPPETATAARDTLGAAVDAAGDLPGNLGAELLETARGAFTDGLHTVAATSCALLLFVAVLVLIVLRKPPSGGAAAAAGTGETPSHEEVPSRDDAPSHDDAPGAGRTADGADASGVSSTARREQS